jgi:hypothetical protein
MNKKQFRETYPYEKYPTPYLVQRLLPPSEVKFGGVRVDQVFAFGGGGSGLSKEAWELLKPLFEFDYMGAAEFEFGAFPKSLEKFLKHKRVDFTIDIKAKDVADSFDRRYNRSKLDLPQKKDGKVFVLCREDQKDFVEAVIRIFAKNDHGIISTKEHVGLVEALDPVGEKEFRRACGWYELDSGFFFFTDESMWERTKKLFQEAK